MLGLVAFTLLAAPSAVGRGGFVIPAEHGDGARSGGTGTASFNFSLFGGSRPGGTLLYAAEDHGDMRYPHVVVRLSSVRSLTIDGRTAILSGEGEFHDEPATIDVIILDGGPKGRGDRFSIRVKKGETILYNRAGNLEVGDLEVKP